MYENTGSKENHLLRAMAPEIRQHLLAAAELVRLKAGEVLYEPGERLRYAYFPVDLVAILLYTGQDGTSSEYATVGNDGMLSVALFLGAEQTPHHAVVLNGGTAYRVNAAALREEVTHSPVLRRVLLRYVQSLITQTALMAACHRHHSVEQQLRRLLLMSMDRLPDNNLSMTQEMIATSMGVRREGITKAAGELQAKGIIAYRRGHITILDRKQLEHSCCECYSVVKRDFGAATGTTQGVALAH